MIWEQWVVPRSTDERVARQEQLVNILALGSAACGAAYLITVLVLGLFPQGDVHWESLVGGVLCVTLAATAYFLSRRGQVRAGAILIVAAAVLIGLYSGSVRGSITVAAVLLVPAVLFAGLAISGRAGAIVAGVELFLYGLLTLARTLKWIPQPSLGLSLWTGLVLIAAVLALVALVTWQTMRSLEVSLQQGEERERTLHTLNADLRQALSQREEKETALQQALDQVRQSQEEQAYLQGELQRLATPVVPVYEGVLVMPLVGMINEDRAQSIMEALLRAVEQQGARVVILDITGVLMVDTAVAQRLLAAARSAHLLGAESVLVGISPQVAETIVSLGMDLSDLTTQADLQSGLAYALRRLSQGALTGRRPVGR